MNTQQSPMAFQSMYPVLGGNPSLNFDSDANNSYTHNQVPNVPVFEVVIESGKDYRPFTDIHRIKANDAKKEAGVDPRAQVKGVPKNYLGVMSWDETSSNSPRIPRKSTTKRSKRASPEIDFASVQEVSFDAQYFSQISPGPEAAQLGSFSASNALDTTSRGDFITAEAPTIINMLDTSDSMDTRPESAFSRTYEENMSIADCSGMVDLLNWSSQPEIDFPIHDSDVAVAPNTPIMMDNYQCRRLSESSRLDMPYMFQGTDALSPDSPGSISPTSVLNTPDSDLSYQSFTDFNSSPYFRQSYPELSQYNVYEIDAPCLNSLGDDDFVDPDTFGYSHTCDQSTFNEQQDRGILDNALFYCNMLPVQSFEL